MNDSKVNEPPTTPAKTKARGVPSSMADEDGDEMHDETDLIQALGLSGLEEHDDMMQDSQEAPEEPLTETEYQVVPNPEAEKIDLSELRGVGSGEKKKKHQQEAENNNSETELENLAELVPGVKARHRGMSDNELPMPADDAIVVTADDGEIEAMPREPERVDRRPSKSSAPPSPDRKKSSQHSSAAFLDQSGSMVAQKSREMEESGRSKPAPVVATTRQTYDPDEYNAEDEASSVGRGGGGDRDDNDTFDDYPDSEHALQDDEQQQQQQQGASSKIIPKEFMNMSSSAQSISTATQTHEVRMPMYLPTFKPATGCTNASDFIVRCFVARLRSGITVVKHGRSRWCKSRLRVLHIHPDGRSLSWRPAEGEPSSNRRPPKLDLSTCLEVRHAWSPDPQNPMYTGTPILRQKCEAANAHKSFALIFKQRTVDITAVTADQCKVLMEGFSALCFRLQVANLAGGRSGGGAAGKKSPAHRPMPEEDGISTTASATLTNTSTPRGR